MVSTVSTFNKKIAALEEHKRLITRTLKKKILPNRNYEFLILADLEVTLHFYKNSGSGIRSFTCHSAML